MLIVIGFLCAAVHTQAATLRVGAGGEYTTIQAAIAAAEALDVVEVAPGTYTLTERIDIDKALTLRGPQADVDPRPHAASVRQAGSAAEAIIDGNGIDTLLRINVGEVEVNGFEFRNGRVDLIDSPSSAPIKENLIVRYNIIHNSLQDEGIQLKNTHNALIERNYVYNTYGDSINLSYSRFGTIRENECTAANADGANGAIYVYNDAKSSSSPTTNEDMNILIEGNYIHDVNNYGIYVGASGGQDQLIGGGTVKGNMVANSKESAIKIMTCNVVIKCNDVTAADS